MSIEVRGITKTFGDFTALKNVSLEVPTGELVALLGPSGSGKTSLLRIIAGLEVPDTGSILFHGEDATTTLVGERNVGFVFQHYALFRHMTIFENVAFGLRVKPRGVRLPDAEIERRVTELLKLVQLDWLGDRYPHQLSGGQRQRVALARALAVEPRVLLLDEPFGALDAKVRKELRVWLRRLHDDVHVTSVFVTHDQEEALEVADRVVVMNEGRIEQIGTPDDVYEHPATPFVFGFLGNVNLFRGRVQEGQAAIGGSGGDAASTVAYVRPHDIEIIKGEDAADGYQATIIELLAVGPTVRLDLRRSDNGEVIQAEMSKERYRALAIAEGELVMVRPKRMKVFTDPPGRPADA